MKQRDKEWKRVVLPFMLSGSLFSCRYKLTTHGLVLKVKTTFAFSIVGQWPLLHCDSASIHTKRNPVENVSRNLHYH